MTHNEYLYVSGCICVALDWVNSVSFPESAGRYIYTYVLHHVRGTVERYNIPVMCHNVALLVYRCRVLMRLWCLGEWQLLPHFHVGGAVGCVAPNTPKSSHYIMAYLILINILCSPILLLIAAFGGLVYILQISRRCVYAPVSHVQ